jgi:hypothetical protein
MRSNSAALSLGIVSDVARDETLHAQQTLRLTGALLFATLLLQRFGMPFGSKPISLVGPIGFLIVGIGLARGTLSIDRRRLLIFLALCGWVAVGLIWQNTHPNPFGVGADFSSLAQFLVLTSFAILAFSYPVDEATFFAQVNWWFALIAIAGILQFAAQFIGIRIFQFTGLLPDSILYEAWYNLVIPVGVGELLKSNGFFLIEPSVFSQIMALGLIIELLTARRSRHLALFATGLMLSFSGTGWIVLLSFVLAATLSLGGRGVLMAVGTFVVLGFTIGITVLLAPDMAAAFGDRIGEFSEVGTSAHMRFVTPFWLMSDVLARAPYAFALGIGSGASEAVYMPYLYNVNTPIKVFLEYGLPALIAYLALFLTHRHSPVQRALVFPGMVMFLFAGGYQQFPPVLFLILLLLCMARLTPTRQ